MPKTTKQTPAAAYVTLGRDGILSTAIDAIRVARTLIEESTATYAGGRRFNKIAQRHIAELKKETAWISEWLEGAEKDFES